MPDNPISMIKSKITLSTNYTEVASLDPYGMLLPPIGSVAKLHTTLRVLTPTPANNNNNLFKYVTSLWRPDIRLQHLAVTDHPYMLCSLHTVQGSLYDRITKLIILYSYNRKLDSNKNAWANDAQYNVTKGQMLGTEWKEQSLDRVSCSLMGCLCSLCLWKLNIDTGLHIENRASSQRQNLPLWNSYCFSKTVSSSLSCPCLIRDSKMFHTDPSQKSQVSILVSMKHRILCSTLYQRRSVTLVYWTQVTVWSCKQYYIYSQVVTLRQWFQNPEYMCYPI